MTIYVLALFHIRIFLLTNLGSTDDLMELGTRIAQLDATFAIFEVSTAFVLRIQVVTLRSGVIDSHRFEIT